MAVSTIFRAFDENSSSAPICGPKCMWAFGQTKVVFSFGMLAGIARHCTILILTNMVKFSQSFGHKVIQS